MPTFDCFALSDAGRDPDGNEDACVLDEGAGVFVIADGVGGRPGGARASRVAATTFVDLLRGTPPSQRLENATLENAVSRVHDAVLRAGDEDENVRGLASTLSAVVVEDRQSCLSPDDGQAGLPVFHAKVVHVGDSRVYHLRNGSIEQLTRDHTIAAELEAEGVSGGNIGRRFRSMLSRAIGSGESVTPDVRDVTLASGDCLLLVTDGISKMLAAEELRALASGADAHMICDRIFHAALEKGATDNLTVAVVNVP